MEDGYLTRIETLKRSASLLVRYGGQIIKGEMVIAPINRAYYSERIEPHIGSHHGQDGAEVVESALFRAPMHPGEYIKAREHYSKKPIWRDPWVASSPSVERFHSTSTTEIEATSF